MPSRSRSSKESDQEYAPIQEFHMHSTHNIPYSTSQSSTSAIIWFPINTASMNSTCVIYSFDRPAIYPNLWLAQQQSLLNNFAVQVLWHWVKETLTPPLLCFVTTKQKIMELLQRLERNWKQLEITATDCDTCTVQAGTRGPKVTITKWIVLYIIRCENKFNTSETSDSTRTHLLMSLHLGFLPFFSLLSFFILSLIIDHQSSKLLWKDFSSKFGVKLSWRFRLFPHIWVIGIS